MKYSTTFIGIISMIGITLILTGCGDTRRNDDFSLRHGVATETMNARVSLRVLEENDGVKRVGIIVNNPEGVAIQSVRTWIQFDPSMVRLSNLLIADDRFILFAPGEKSIDDQEGLVKLGGAVREAISDYEVLFASFVVRKVRPSAAEPSSLTFYDWKAEGDGHTAVLSVENKSVRNIVQSPSSLSL